MQIHLNKERISWSEVHPGPKIELKSNLGGPRASLDLKEWMGILGACMNNDYPNFFFGSILGDMNVWDQSIKSI